MNDKLTATLPSADTKMTMGGENGSTPLWGKATEEKISVFTQKESSYTNQEYTLSEGEGTKSGTFTGNSSGETKVAACYPWISGAKYDGDKITFTQPSSYTYKENDNNSAPMAAKISQIQQENIAFKNAGALVDISVKNIPEGYDKVILTSKPGTQGSAPNIAGEMQITFGEGGAPTLAPVAGALESQSITITFTAQNDFQDLRFYFPIPVGNYPELEVSLDNSSATKPIVVKTFRGSDKNGVKADRGQQLCAEITIDKITGVVPEEVASTKDVAEKLGEAGVSAVLIQDVTSGTSETPDPVVIPQALTSSEATPDSKPISISFKSIKTTEPITIKEENASGGTSSETPAKSKATFVLGVPEASQTEGGGKEILPTFNINTPTSTIKFTPTGSSETTINKATVKSAANTVIIDKGIIINELVIAGGNVEIYGVVKKISRTTDNAETNTTVTTYKNGSIGTVEDSNNEFIFKSVWDGVSKVTSARADNKIYTAAELAYYQSANIPVSTTGKNLTATMTATTTLCADIDLNNKPWIGMVLGENAAFDGGKHTISNVLITEHVLNETSIYTPAACVGLFAATKKGSTIKDITVDGFRAEGAGADAKWSGALVGYSYGTTSYTDCHAENVTIESNSADAYRIGGLIGFIGSGSGKEVAVSKCSVNTVTIKGGHSLGGFIGTIQGNATETVTISNCTAKTIAIIQNANSCALNGNGATSAKDYAGNLSKFIGDTGNSATTITLTECSVDAKFTEAELTTLGYNSINGTNGEVWKLQDATSPLIPAQAAGSITIGNNKMVAGTDYNRFTLIKSGSNNAEGYEKTEGAWAD